MANIHKFLRFSVYCCASGANFNIINIATISDASKTIGILFCQKFQFCFHIQYIYIIVILIDVDIKQMMESIAIIARLSAI